MHKKLLGILVLGTLLLAPSAEAGKLVTADIPLTSKYYNYIDKLEAMGFITDMPGSLRPYNRLQVARWLAKVNPTGMQPYLKVYYDELCDALSDEIAYVIAHEPLPQVELLTDASGKPTVLVLGKHHKQKLKQGKPHKLAKQMAKHQQSYHAQDHNWLVREKLKQAQESEHFPTNFDLRSTELEFSQQKMDRTDYAYRRTNASYQPLHGRNNGYRYGDGFNAVGRMHLSGSFGNDLAVGITPRFSYDEDNKGKASLEEGYARTHLGVWGITVGKEALNWGTHLGSAGLSLSDNATPGTSFRLGLLEPWDTRDTVLHWLGKVDFQVFARQLEGNRCSKYGLWRNTLDTSSEYDKGTFWGVRLEVQPKDTFTLGFERLSQMKKFGWNYFLASNDGVTKDGTDYGNDQMGIDFRWKFPGLQIYGALYGEDATYDIGTLFMSNKAKRLGLYFHQLAKDGSWDLKLEYTRNSMAWYTHGAPFGNGWSYHDDILGDPMGNRARKYSATINNYLPNGDVLNFNYCYTKWDCAHSISPVFREYSVGYSHKFSDHLHLDGSLGYGTIHHAAYELHRNEKTKYVALGLRWEY